MLNDVIYEDPADEAEAERREGRRRRRHETGSRRRRMSTERRAVYICLGAVFCMLFALMVAIVTLQVFYHSTDEAVDMVAEDDMFQTTTPEGIMVTQNYTAPNVTSPAFSSSHLLKTSPPVTSSSLNPERPLEDPAGGPWNGKQKLVYTSDSYVQTNGRTFPIPGKDGPLSTLYTSVPSTEFPAPLWHPGSPGSEGPIDVLSAGPSGQSGPSGPLARGPPASPRSPVIKTPPPNSRVLIHTQGMASSNVGKAPEGMYDHPSTLPSTGILNTTNTSSRSNTQKDLSPTLHPTMVRVTKHVWATRSSDFSNLPSRPSPRRPQAPHPVHPARPAPGGMRSGSPGGQTRPRIVGQPPSPEGSLGGPLHPGPQPKGNHKGDGQGHVPPNTSPTKRPPTRRVKQRRKRQRCKPKGPLSGNHIDNLKVSAHNNTLDCEVTNKQYRAQLKDIMLYLLMSLFGLGVVMVVITVVTVKVLDARKRGGCHCCSLSCYPCRDSNVSSAPDSQSLEPSVINAQVQVELRMNDLQRSTSGDSASSDESSSEVGRRATAPDIMAHSVQRLAAGMSPGPQGTNRERTSSVDTNVSDPPSYNEAMGMGVPGMVIHSVSAELPGPNVVVWEPPSYEDVIFSGAAQP